MVYRVTGGLFLLFLGLSEAGLYSAPGMLVGVLGIIAGIALLAGL